MAWVATAIVGTTLIGAAVSSNSANEAANAQTYAADQGVAESRRAQSEATAILRPYVQAGYSSLNSMGDLTGANGDEAYQAEINRIQTSPEFMSLLENGEKGLLANASATGGLRGGDTQRALMEMRPALLSDQINKRYAQYGGLTQIGQASAAGEASAQLQTGQNIVGLQQQRGAAAAGESIAQGNIISGLTNQVGSMIGGGF